MTRLPHLALVLSTLVTATACGGGSTAPNEPKACEMAPTPSPLVGTKLAEVNGHEVGSVGWEAFAQRKSPADGNTWTLDEKKAVLDEVIADELLLQEAFRRGVYQDPKVRKIMANLLLRAEVYEKVGNDDFTDEEMRAYFQEHKEDFVVPEKVQIKRIFVAAGEKRDAAEAKAIANDLYNKVSAKPDTFREIAVDASEGPFARRGGDIGYVDRQGKPGLPGSVVTRAFLLEQGAMTEPFEAAGGFNIVYVPQRRERIERSFEQMRGAVLRRLKHERYEALTDAFVASLREAGTITIDDGALGSWSPAKAKSPGLNLPLPKAQAKPQPAETMGVDEDGNPVELIHGFPKTGDPITDMGDANDEALKAFQEAEAAKLGDAPE